MKVNEYNQMMAYLLRPKPKMQVADLADDLEPGSLKDELLKDFDPSQETYEEYLQRKNLDRPFNAQDGGRVKLQAGTPITTDTLSKSEYNKIKKLLEDKPGLGIFPTARKGAYTLKLKVEKAGRIIQKDLGYTKENFKTILKDYDVARAQLFPNVITDAKFKELRLLNSELTDSQFADLLNENNYLTSKGNKFTGTVAFNYKRRLGLGSLGPRTFRSLKEAENIVKDKFGKDFKKIFKTESEIKTKATQLINDVDKIKLKGSFPRGNNVESYFWHSLNRAARQGSRQITYDLSELGGELPMEKGNINWNKKIKGQPAWKLVKFVDNDVGKTFNWSDTRGDIKNQINTAYNNPNKFNKAVKGFYEQAAINQKFGNAARDQIILKELRARLGRPLTKADSDLAKKFLKNKRPGFGFSQVHHPQGVATNVYNTQNVYTAANLKERDLQKTFSKEIKTIGQKAAQENLKQGIVNLSEEMGGIQTKIGGRYFGKAPTKESIIKQVGKVLKTTGKVVKPLGYAIGPFAVMSARAKADDMGIELSFADQAKAFDAGDADVAIDSYKRRTDPDYAAQERAKDLAKMTDDFEEVGLNEIQPLDKIEPLDDIGMQEYTEDYAI